MKNIFKIGSLLLIVLTTVACEDLLEEEPKSNISLANFYQSETDAIAGLYGAYDGIYGMYGRNAINHGETAADNLTVPQLVSDQLQWDEFTSNNNVLGGYWGGAFSGINRANEVIFYTERIDFEAGRKADIIAEAKALRAIYYFNMVRLMGGVPLYETPTVSFETAFAPRATEDEIYSVITRDLVAAATELETTSPAGRINSGIANAMAARVFLYRKDYANALIHAEAVINSGVYSLFSDYADIFKTANNNGVEHIYQLQYLTDERNNGMADWFGPRIQKGELKNAFLASGIVNGSYEPTTDFVNDAPPSYRTNVTISDQFEHIDGVSGTVTMADAFDGTFPFYISKFDDRLNTLNSGANYNVIRYADVLLIAAEALNEETPGDDRKYTWINEVRERGRNNVATDLPDLAGLSQDDFRTAVLDERRFELAFEGQRAWDLKRKDVFLSTMRAQGKTIEDFKLYFAIPESQRDLNPDLSQNDGWEGQ